MSDFKIKVNVAGVVRSEKIIKRSFDSIKKEALGVDKSIGVIERAFKRLESNSKKSLRAMKSNTRNLRSVRNAINNNTNAIKLEIKALSSEIRLLNKSTTAQKKNTIAKNKSIKASKGLLGNLTKQITVGNLLANVLATSTNFLKDQIIALKRYSDEWIKITNIIRLGIKTESELITVRKKVFDISQETRTDLLAQTTLFNRLTLSQRELGASSEDILSVIRGVGHALGVTATSALESRGSLIQLAQAFGQPIVRAEEFNSILEGTPRIAKALADGFGLTRSGLRKLVLAGKVTNREFFQAFRTQLPLLEKEFSKVNMTIEQSIILFRNAFVRLVGMFNEGTGAAKSFAGFIGGIAGALQGLTPSIIWVGTAFKSVFNLITALPKGIVEYLDDLKNGFIRLSGDVKIFKSIAEALKEINKNLDETNEKMKTAFSNLTPLQKIETVIINLGKNILRGFTAIMSSIGKGFAFVINSILKLINKLAINLVALGSLTKNIFTGNFADAKVDIEALNISWKDYFIESKVDWENYEKSVDKINEDANKNRIKLTSAEGKSKLALKKEEIAFIIAEDEKYFRILESKKKGDEDALKEIKAFELARLEVIKKNFRATGIISKLEKRILILDIIEKSKEEIKAGLSVASATEAVKYKIDAINSKIFQKNQERLKKIQKENRERYAEDIKAATYIKDLNLDRIESIRKNQESVDKEIARRHKKEQQDELKTILIKARAMKDLNLIRLEDLRVLEISPIGAQTVFEKYIETLHETANATTRFEDLTISSFSNMEDALVSFVMKGKFEFKSFALSIIEDMARIEAKRLSSAILGGDSGGGIGDLFKGLLSGLGGGSGYMTPTGGGPGTMWPSFDTGGFMSPTGTKKPFPAIVHSGEVIGTPNQMSEVYGGGDEPKVTNIYINAIDTQTFNDYVRKNPEGIITAVDENISGGGQLRGTIGGTL